MNGCGSGGEICWIDLSTGVRSADIQHAVSCGCHESCKYAVWDGECLGPEQTRILSQSPPAPRSGRGVLGSLIGHSSDPSNEVKGGRKQDAGRRKVGGNASDGERWASQRWLILSEWHGVNATGETWWARSKQWRRVQHWED